MDSKWMKLGMFAAAAALIGTLAVSTPALAAGGPPPAAGSGYGVGGRGAWGGPDNALVTVAAGVLGLDRAELAADLAAGQTIAQVAEAQGVAPEAIVDAALAPRAAALQAAVSAGRLTQAQADARLATMRAHLTAQLNAPHTPRGPGQGDPGAAFVDADGDGVCDNTGTARPQGPRGNHGP